MTSCCPRRLTQPRPEGAGLTRRPTQKKRLLSWSLPEPSAWAPAKDCWPVSRWVTSSGTCLGRAGRAGPHHLAEAAEWGVACERSAASSLSWYLARGPVWRPAFPGTAGNRQALQQVAGRGGAQGVGGDADRTPLGTAGGAHLPQTGVRLRPPPGAC